VTRRIMYTGYRPETLAQAWALYAQSLLRQAERPGLVQSERVSLVDLGTDAAKQSMLAHHHDFGGAMVLAQLLLKRSILLAATDLDSAQAAWDEAAELLLAIPEDSARAGLAAYLMRNVRRP